MMQNKDLDVVMYIIDENYKILYQNEEAAKMHPGAQVGNVCYKFYGGVDAPCAQCPVKLKNALIYNSHRKEWVDAQAAKMELPEHGTCYAIQFQIKQRLHSVPLKDTEADYQDIDECFSEFQAVNGNECQIGAFYEEGLPLFYVNDNMIHLLGYDSRKEFEARIDGMAINTIHPDDREATLERAQEAYEQGRTYETMYRMPKKDGSWFWVVNKGKILETKKGRIIFIGVCTDMTAHLKRHESLRLQNDDLIRKEFLTTAMMNNMPSGYHRCAAEEGCPFLFIGSHFESIVGWSREEIETEFDNLFCNMIWPEDAPNVRIYSDMAGMKGKGNSYSTDIYRMKKKGGGYRWVLDATMFVDLGEDSFFQATLADITDFVETRNAQKRELEEAMVKIEEANNAKTQFLYSMSHDIRTPMNAIIGMTTLATKHIDDTDYVKKCLSKMSLASRHLLTLINDVLDISKVESGTMVLNPIVFSLPNAVTNLFNIVREQISAKGHRFDVRVHNIQQEYLFADELRLNQIFINILTNAVKYTPAGGKIAVDIKQESIEGVPDRIRLIYIVQDNGVGMSREFQENMYNSFARARNASYDSMQGTGLGLTISKTLIDLMGGTIECESQPGEGTKFTVTLEVSLADRIMDELILPPMEILVVDDDSIFLESAADTLRGMGLTPDCVTCGEDAIERTMERHRQGRDYPVIIVDWQMPGMNGLETVREIRAQVGEDVSILVVSAYEWTGIEEDAKAAGANGFISKLFFPSNVYENLVEILGLTLEKNEEDEKYREEIAGMHVLIAEDNDLNWEIAKELLAMYHVTTDRAENGQACVEKINTAADGAYDLILMDIRMPVMNGYEATEQIRAAKRDYIRNIPIVAMTADAFSDDIKRCIEVGMNAHIAKPININQLVTVLKNRGS